MKTTIIDFYIEPTEVIIDLTINGKEFRVAINANDLQAWLLKNDKLSYTEGSTGKDGIMAMDEYWRVYIKYVQADLVAYVKSAKITCNGLDHIGVENLYKWSTSELYGRVKNAKPLAYNKLFL